MSLSAHFLTSCGLSGKPSQAASHKSLKAGSKSRLACWLPSCFAFSQALRKAPFPLVLQLHHLNVNTLVVFHGMLVSLLKPKYCWCSFAVCEPWIAVWIFETWHPWIEEFVARSMLMSFRMWCKKGGGRHVAWLPALSWKKFGAMRTFLSTESGCKTCSCFVWKSQPSEISGAMGEDALTYYFTG